MVTTIAVMYPNGWIPTSVPTMPAKIIKSQALTKNNGPAAKSLKNVSMFNHLLFRFTTASCDRASADRPVRPGRPALPGTTSAGSDR
jgi:hypothetical protein